MSPEGVAIYDPRDFIWTNLNLLAPRMLHATYQRIPAGGSWEDFWRFIKIFLILPLIGAPKGASPYIWTNLNSHPPIVFPTKFGWNWPSGSWEEVV